MMNRITTCFFPQTFLKTYPKLAENRSLFFHLNTDFARTTSIERKIIPLNHNFPRVQTDNVQPWIVFLAIALAAAFLTSKRVEAQEEELTWQEIELLAHLFEVPFPEIRNQESLKKTALSCFHAAFQACLEGNWALIDQAEPTTLAKLTDSWGQTLLIAAAGEGNKGALEGLLKQKIALEKRDREGNTPLHVVAKNGFSHLVPILCDYYIEDLNNQGKNSYHLAIEYGHLSVLKTLISKKPISRSLKEGNLTLTLPALCVKYSQKECLNYLLQQAGYCVDERIPKLGTLLHVAIYYGQFGILKTIVAHPKASSLLQQYDDQGRNPLALAAFLGDLEAVDFLYRKVGNSCGENGWTAAHWAVSGKQGKVVELLAYLGMNLETKDGEGKRPKAILNQDTSIEAKEVRNILSSLIANKDLIKRSPLDFLSEPPEGIVFKGGGPRGLAYLEALRALKEKRALNKVQRTAGTSAGAITAAIFALDPFLQDIDALENLDLMQFLDPIPGKESILKGMLTGKDKEGTMSKIVSGTFDVVREANSPSKLYNAFSQLDGICQGENLRKWIEEEISKRTGIENCTFGELKKEIQKGKKFLHLHVYTTRLEGNSEEKILHFSSENDKWDNVVISDAIRASMSIPGVYVPFTVREKTRSNTLNPRTDLGPCVDGGLIKNFPIDAFDRPSEGEYYPSFNRRTLGLCLKDVDQSPTKTAPVSGILNIAQACASVYWAAEEIYIFEVQENRHRIIEIPIRGVGLCDFNLTKEQKEGLLKGGREGIESSPFARKGEQSELLVHMKANNLPMQLPFFTGRQEEMRSLEKSFLSQPLDDSVVRLIYGLGGMGKTELARAFARNHREDFSIIWFINAASTEQENQSYRALAEELKIEILDKEPPEQIVRKVKSRLKNHSYEKPWLLVFDNLEKEIELPQGGYVLITSRNREVWKNAKEHIELLEFNAVDSLKILEDIAQKKSPRMAELAKELGHFPLALNQAAHYIRDSCSIEEYLTELKKNPIHGKMTPSERYQKTLENVWQITLEKLEKEHPKASAWLKICAHLNPDDVPQEWLVDWLKNQSEEVNDWEKIEITKVLADLSLIRPKGEGYSMHRLMQLVVKDTASAEKEFVRACELVEIKKQAINDWKGEEKWIVQAVSVEKSPLFKNNIDPRIQIRLLSSLGMSLENLGRDEEALDYNQKALKISEEVLPHNHPDLANGYNNVGVSLSNLGRDEEALDYNQKALKIREEALPHNHPDLANSYNNIGVNLGNLERYEEALDYNQKALKIREEALPHNHPDLANSYDNIGVSLRNLGRYEEALDYDQKALKIREEALPHNHPDLANSYYSIAINLGNLERYEEALDYAQKDLKIREEALPHNHPDLANSYYNIGISLRKLGRYEEALDYNQKALKIREEALPHNHPDLANSYNNIAINLGNLERYEEALDYNQKALKIREEALPHNHPDLANSYNKIGVNLSNLGRYEEALDFAQKALVRCASQTNHPNHELYLTNFIDVLKKQFNAQLVEKSKQEILLLYTKKLGENHPLIQELKKVHSTKPSCTFF